MHCFHSKRFHLSVDCWIQTVSPEFGIDWRTFHCVKLRSSVYFMQHTPLGLIVENILPGARVIPNISCEEPHGLIVTNNVPPNFEQELAFNDEASFDTSNVFSQKSKLIVDSIPSSEGA